jgi:hypothetical protein
VKTAADLDAFVDAVEAVTGRPARRSGSNVTLCCPAHDDRSPSLSVRAGDDGRILVHCHAGCPTQAVVDAVGWRMADLFAEPYPDPAPRPGPVSVERLAAAKRLNPDLLYGFGLRDVPGGGGVVIPYTDPGTGEVIEKRRTAIVAKQGSRWPAGKPLCVYGAERLGPALPRAEPLLILEGESDCWVAWSHGCQALGVPGASAADLIPDVLAEVIRCFPAVYVAEEIDPATGEPDGGGRVFPRSVGRRLRELGYAGPIRVLRAGSGCKDLADLHVRDPVRFRDALAAAMQAARPWAESETETGAEAETGAGPVLTCLADVSPREVQWLWPGRVPLGRVTLLVGRPGEGKSFVTSDMAARVTTGTPWPDGSECPAGSVILISAEDDPADTIRPRLDAHAADVRRVHLLSSVRRHGRDGRPRESMFTLADVASLESALTRVPDCRLIVIDPIGSYLGGDTDAHRDNEVRAVLAPVAALAARYAAAVLVVAHRRKAGGNIADDLALGSRAFTGLARAVWHLTREEGNRARRLLLPGKNNLAAPAGGLGFYIAGRPPSIVWEPDPVEMSADDVLAQEHASGRGGGREPESRTSAAEWLYEMLEGGPRPASAIKDAAAAAGYSWRTVHRAREFLGIVPRRDGRQWTWALPDQAEPDPAAPGLAEPAAPDQAAPAAP